jgi:hypothetical protein
MKLISMTDFVLEQKQSTSIKEKKFIDDELISIEKIRNYANFLKQPLTLGMFVPCDEEGNILEEPIDNLETKNCDELDSFNNLVVEYDKAKEHVLFEGFKINENVSISCENLILYIFWNYSGTWKLSHGIYTIEDLVEYNLTLTESAIKKIGL